MDYIDVLSTTFTGFTGFTSQVPSQNLGFSDIFVHFSFQARQSFDTLQAPAVERETGGKQGADQSHGPANGAGHR